MKKFSALIAAALAVTSISASAGVAGVGGATSSAEIEGLLLDSSLVTSKAGGVSVVGDDKGGNLQVRAIRLDSSLTTAQAPLAEQAAGDLLVYGAEALMLDSSTATSESAQEAREAAI